MEGPPTTTQTTDLSKSSTKELCSQLKKTKDQSQIANICAELEKRLSSLSGSQLCLLLSKGSSNQETVLNMIHTKRDTLTDHQLMNVLPFLTETAKRIDFIKVLISREANLSGDALCQLHQIAPPELQVTLNDLLYKRMHTLSMKELIYLTKISATGAPPPFHAILEAMWNTEKKREERENLRYFSSRMFAVTVPKMIQCRPQLPVASNIHHQGEFEANFPLHYLTPLDNDRWYVSDVLELTEFSFIDLCGDLISTLGSQHGISFDLLLCKELDASKGAAVYLSVPPSCKDVVLVGYITSSSPSFCLKYPFPTFGAVQIIRVGLRIMPINDILAEIKNKKEEKVPEAQVLAALLESTPKTENSMIVCYGEVHQFTVDPEENMLSIAKRTCRRWNVSADEFEIQDVHFKTYPDDMTWKAYLASGGSTVTRLVRKAGQHSAAGFPITPVKMGDNTWSGWKPGQTAPGGAGGMGGFGGGIGGGLGAFGSPGGAGNQGQGWGFGFRQ